MEQSLPAIVRTIFTKLTIRRVQRLQRFNLLPPRCIELFVAMPPKQQPVVKKSQPNLFSFFNKPKAAEATKPVPAITVGNTTPSRENATVTSERETFIGSAATSKAGDSPFSAPSSQESNCTPNDTSCIRSNFNQRPDGKKRNASEVDTKNLVDGSLSIVERGNTA